MFHLVKIFFKKFLILTLFITFSSCKATKEIDKSSQMDWGIDKSKKEYEDYFIKNKPKRFQRDVTLNYKSEGATTPSVSKLLITPPPPAIGGEKKISLSVTDEIPLKDVLIELGRSAKIDIDIDPAITGGIILNANNRPLKEVIDRIATLGKIRYVYKNGVLRFEKDSPFDSNYYVDLLPESTVWQELETGLGKILENHSAARSNSEEVSVGQSSVYVNKPAGIISVFANEVQQKLAKRYIDEVMESASAQVLIEARILEVSLSKEFSAGIDWTWVTKNSTVKSATGSSSSQPLLVSLAGKRFLGTGSLSSTVSALEKFGTTRGISSPRINAMNNQKASLDFSEKFIYFTVSSSAVSTPGTGGSATTVTSAISASKNELPIGIKLDITPSINIKRREITLDVKPKISVKSETNAVDPTTDSQGNSLGNKIPQAIERSLTTLAKIKDGEILVIGGLVTEDGSGTNNGLPLIQRIPIIGWLFKTVNRKNSTKETVIFLKASIIDRDLPLDPYDAKLHKTFSHSGRPFID